MRHLRHFFEQNYIGVKKQAAKLQVYFQTKGMAKCANPYQSAANPGHRRLEWKKQGFLYLTLQR
jgi:hypothetical protein